MKLMVSATDTGVGKTTVSTALLRYWRSQGYSTMGYKPAETGCPANAWPHDALALEVAAQSGLSLDQICPYRFEAAMSPYSAALHHGASIDIEVIAQGAKALDTVDYGLLEGAGGLAVPITAQHDYADLAVMLKLPLLLVCRAALGTQNHTRLSVAYAKSKGIKLLGLVVNGFDANTSDVSQHSSVEQLEQLAGVPVLGVLPQESDPAVLAGLLEGTGTAQRIHQALEHLS